MWLCTVLRVPSADAAVAGPSSSRCVPLLCPSSALPPPGLQVFCKRRPEMHIFAARYDERHGRVDAARTRFKLVVTTLAPRLLEAVTAAANFERRQVCAAAPVLVCGYLPACVARRTSCGCCLGGSCSPPPRYICAPPGGHNQANEASVSLVHRLWAMAAAAAASSWFVGGHAAVPCGARLRAAATRAVLCCSALYRSYRRPT